VEATAQVRQSIRVALFTVPSMFVLAGAASFLLVSDNGIGVALGVLAVLAAVGLFVVFIRSRLKVIHAVSQWFGVPLRWGDFPKMQTKEFDAWCERKGLSRPREQA
jgi:hypothetical protein